jgi:hypothetical protein
VAEVADAMIKAALLGEPGLDHGVGHRLLLCNTKAPNYQKNNVFIV